MSVVVGGEYEHRGVGTKLMEELLHLAKTDGYEGAEATTCNRYVVKIMDKLGFERLATRPFTEVPGYDKIPEEFLSNIADEVFSHNVRLFE